MPRAVILLVAPRPLVLEIGEKERAPGGFPVTIARPAFEEIRAAFPTERIRVADRGLREGILTQLMKQDGTYGRPR